MSTSADPDKLREVLTAQAEATLKMLLAFGLPARPLAVGVTIGGARLQLAVVPEGKKLAPQISECGRDILLILGAVNGRLTTPRLLGELESRGLIHGERTVKQALHDLKALGLIQSSRKSPQGYCLAATNGAAR